MVAIIGSRGSGKTALADLIAHVGNSSFPLEGAQSFLTRAQPLLLGANVVATWSDSSNSESNLAEMPEDLPDVHYMTQQFVDRLCSSVAESDELLDEIKRVVFLAHEPASRLGADDFESLVRFRSSEAQLAVESLNQRLDRLSQDLFVERSLSMRKSTLQRDLDKVKEELARTGESRKRLIRPGGQERADYYTRLSHAISEREQEVQQASRELQAFKKLQTEVERYRRDIFPRLLADLRQVYGEATLSEKEWPAFQPIFAGDPSAILSAKQLAHEQLIESIKARSGRTPTVNSASDELAQCSLSSLRDEHTSVGEQIGTDKKNVQRLEQLNKLVASQDATRRRLEEELARARQSGDRLKTILAERAALYGRFFDLIIEQCNILDQLYEPLAWRLAVATGSSGKLSLRVVRQVDVDAWAQAGESLLDLRKNGEFRGRGALGVAAVRDLVPAWQNGSASEVAAAMEAFRDKYNKTMLAQSIFDQGTDEHQQWVVDLARWLYSTDHIDVHYSIEYEGVAITQLSPGTRGIVLLLLYLALDLEDSRPLIIDQPEENLDPRSVFTELIELFREARLRRQVIIVTHNANLVVNTDVDQVIVASCTKSGSGSPPEFRYECGGLENASIRAQVCDILEGGEAAFRARAKRLRVDIGTR